MIQIIDHKMKGRYQMGKKVRYLGESDPLTLLNGKTYEVIEEDEEGYYRIIDETGDDYLYDTDAFEVVEEGESP